MVDTHCHPNDACYQDDPKGYFLEARKTGVTGFLVIGWDLASSRLALKMAKENDDVFAAVGIHPSDVSKAGKDDLSKIEELLSDPRVLAVGEIGLDHHWEKDKEAQKRQKEMFREQIRLANRHGLPISIHCREAAEECLRILKECPPQHGGVMHCYAGGPELMNEFLKCGLLIGIGGTSTFKKAEAVKEVARRVPLDAFILETDAPYLAPEPYRGKRNHSKYLGAVLRNLAILKGIDEKVLEEAADANFRRVFLHREG